MLLEAIGYEASLAHDGNQALESIKMHSPDVVLLDIGLPGLSGIEVARRVKTEILKQPALIAVTGYGQERDREASYDAGFIAHLTKPVDIDKLTALLQRVAPP